MINKKLSTSLCDINFSFGEFNDPTQYQLFRDNECTQSISLPSTQHKYFYETVDVPDGYCNVSSNRYVAERWRVGGVVACRGCRSILCLVCFLVFLVGSN